jgi:hypothetical protein
VGNVVGEFMTTWSSHATDEMGETRGVVHIEAADVLASRVRQEKGWGVHGTPNCRYEHAEQNL